MELSKLKIGFAITGSYCTFDKVFPNISDIVKTGAEVIPIMSESAYNNNTRFGKAEDFRNKLISLTGNNIVTTINEAEPIGPKGLLDILIIAPCTGNTLAKIANGITDTCVTMAAKAHLRNAKPLVIGISTNDGLSTNAVNIGLLINRKNVFFVPFRQDDPVKKQNSLVAKMDLIIPTVKSALNGEQYQPVVLGTVN